VISGCPNDPDEIAELLCLGRLDGRTAQKFVEHMSRCRECQKVYEINTVFINALRGSRRSPGKGRSTHFRMRWVIRS
jgi:hypothetical protein